MMAWIWISKMNVSGIFKNTDLPYTKNILYLSSSGWHSILGCILKFVLDKILQYFYSIFLRLLFIEARIFNIYDRARRLNFFCKFIFMIPFFYHRPWRKCFNLHRIECLDSWLGSTFSSYLCLYIQNGLNLFLLTVIYMLTKRNWFLLFFLPVYFWW